MLLHVHCIIVYFSLVRQNSSHHWLPATLKLFPKSVTLIHQQLEALGKSLTDNHGDNGKVLHGHVVLLKTARNNHSQLEWVLLITAFLYTAFQGKLNSYSI